MSVYSLYPGPDDIRILAACGCPDGVVSSVVTSVDEAEFADLLVETLNEISACATVPVSVWDRRRLGFHEYPATHLRALTDRDARADLLTGAHSLWYERVKVLLHRALVDLDHLLARTSEPVRTAIATELETEVRALRAELDYMNGIATPDHVKRRYWRRESPLVDHGRLDDLNPSTRESLDRAERGASMERLEAGVLDMRLLEQVRWQHDNDGAIFYVERLSIDHHPLDSDAEWCELDVEAPLPSGNRGRGNWAAVIKKTVPVDPRADDNMVVTVPVLRCVRPSRPTAEDIVELLNRSAGGTEQIVAWAATPVGETLVGTTFVVTERCDGPE